MALWIAALILTASTAIAERIDAFRPAPVTQAERERVLATLPARGEVSNLNAAQRQKLAAVRGMLELHGRETVYVIKVIDVPQAAVGLHARVVVLMSEATLNLLDADEMKALVAHEVGHEFFWSEYVEARDSDDGARLRRLELLCDGVAIVTLRRAGLDSKPLTSALEKVVTYNRHRFGAALNEDHYPDIGDRKAFAKRLDAWLQPRDRRAGAPLLAP